MQYLISIIIGYILGSIPTAFLVMKKKGIDITTAGSGNVGAMNTYEVSKSKLTGFIVFAVDFIKGFISVVLMEIIYPNEFIYPALALLFAVLSHCFNPWINFKGGRGLATAAGGTILLFPYLLISWIIIWVISYLYKKDILLSNILATPLSLLTVLGKPELAVKYTFPQPKDINSLILFSVAGLTIIFIKHIDPLKEIIQSYKSKGLRK
ncbi:glycerol-3-phosphate acyltransferase [Ignavibacterium sp.]|uniref:glycerol-3-phosphate acyltransferase n=1 Tax=Ignavibacterium sp. TaxID=2651167 RepID=UPI0022014C3A|nr:glycerol-3-phosphate acyltransferase [Ignavibacterium sp.]BDQ01805.1 MAG: glycerol-3-phosphate acyltransferase [Ignavibacterium sp.]